MKRIICRIRGHRWRYIRTEDFGPQPIDCARCGMSAAYGKFKFPRIRFTP